MLAVDHEGRPWRLVDGSVTYRWGLNGRVLAVEREGAGGKNRRWMEVEDGIVVWETVRERLAPLLDRAGPGGLSGLSYSGGGETDGARDDLNEVMQRLAKRDGTALSEDFGRFGEIYTPIGILPPDQYMARVVQLTHGCRFNTCTFCTLYRDIPFSVKSVTELKSHLAAVDSFLGRGASLRRGIFLGDANALTAPMSELAPLVAEVQSHYSGELDEGVGMHSFLDGFSGSRKCAADFKHLRQLGLSRICVGMESGHDPLLRWLNKPGSVSDVVKSIEAIKVAGLQVSVVVLLGAGGNKFSEGHIRDTRRVLAGLPLDSADIVYFSEYVEEAGAPYGVIASEDGIAPLGREAVNGQRGEIVSSLRPWSEGGPKSASYDIREFTY